MTGYTQWKKPDFSLDDRLMELDKEELYDLLQDLMICDPDVKRHILEWLREREDCEDNEKLDEELLMEYWENAKCIISEFNEYGGGPWEEEVEAYEWLDKILNLIEAGNISTETKFAFMDSAFEEYDVNNSGFEDTLVEIFFKLCKTEEEWKYLIKKFNQKPSSWRKKLIMEIYRDHLHDDRAYLRERKSNLKYGLDYWELVRFYLDKRKHNLAVATAEEGVRKGEGRLTELFDFLFDHYARRKDTFNLERIVRISLERKSEAVNMLDKLFDYYKSLDNYNRAKET